MGSCIKHTLRVDIWEDVAEECGKFGRIVDMKIPKPQGGQPVAGLGKVNRMCGNRS